MAAISSGVTIGITDPDARSPRGVPRGHREVEDGGVTGGRMTLDLDAGPWSTVTLAMAHGVAAQGHLSIELASRTGRPRRTADRGGSVAPQVVVDGSVASYALWSGSTLVAACRPPPRRSPLGLPVLLAGRHLTRCERFGRLVVGVDGADPSMLVVEAAAGLASTIGATLTLVEIVEPPAGHVDVPDSAHLHHVGSRLSRPPDDYDTVRSAEPATAILRYVGRRTDTIIVLGRSCSARTRVVRRLLRSSPCPVLLVPTGH